MNRVKLTIIDDNGKTLCKIGTSIDPPIGLEYNDKELADALADMATMLYKSHTERVALLTEKWKAVLDYNDDAPSPKALLIEAQEVKFEM